MPESNESDLQRTCSVSQRLADYVVGLSGSRLDPKTKDTVWRCLLDVLTSAAAGQSLDGVKAAQLASTAIYGAGSSPVWFTDQSASCGAAIFANSTATAALDLDDGYRRARGHPGAAIIPAALAIARSDHSISPEDFATAVVAGYEVALRLAMARPTYAPSGAWSGFGVVATAGKLLNVDERVIANALAIVAQTAPGLPALAGLAGSDVKEGIGAGVAAGWAALQLAMTGFSGPLSVLDDPRLFNQDIALDRLGEVHLINGTYFKPFGCCRHIHAPLDAMFKLRADHGFAPEDVSAINVHTYQATFNLSNLSRPTTLVQAQYSVPYCLSVGVVHGADALVPLGIQHLTDADVLAMATRVNVLHDPNIEPLFPERSPASVSITLRDGTVLDSGVIDARGDPAQPLTQADLERKFRVASREVLEPANQQALLDALMAVRKGDWEPLFAAISAPSEAA